MNDWALPCSWTDDEQNYFESLILTQVSEPGPVMYWFDLVLFLFSLFCTFGPMNLVFDTKSMSLVHEKSVGLALGWMIVSLGLELLIFSIYNFIANYLIPFFKQYIIRRQIWSHVRAFWCAVSQFRNCDNLDFFQQALPFHNWGFSLLTMFLKLCRSWFNKCAYVYPNWLSLFIQFFGNGEG